MSKQIYAVIAAAGIGFVSTAWGQETQLQTSTSSSAAKPTEESTGLEEVVVTARRREENAQHAAIAISSLTANDVANANVTRAGDLSTLVPALQIADSTGPYDVFFVRGVGNFAGTALTDAAVTTNFNGVTVTRSGTAGFFYDLARVEVLKGPQGTLYGRNATGGVINIISNAPVLDSFAGEATVQAGNYSTVRTDAMLNVPLGNSAAVRGAAFHVQHAGYMNDGTDNQNDSGGRLSFLVNPAESLSISVVADYMHQGGGEIVGTTLIGENTSFLPGPSFPPSARNGLFSPAVTAFLATQPNFVNGRTFAPFLNASHEDNTYWGVSSTVNWMSPIGVFTVIPAYRRSNVDYDSFASGVQLVEKTVETETSIEARLASDTQRSLSYIVGLYYLHNPLEEPAFDVNQQSVATFQSYRVKTDSRAAFASLTYAIIPAVRLTGGVRYTKDDKDFLGTSTANTVFCTQGFLGCPNAPLLPYTQLSPSAPNFNPFAPGANGTLTFLSTFQNGPESASYSRITWRTAIEADVTDQNLIYGSVETGYRSGGFSFSTDAETQTFKPESIRAFALGSKNRFLDNRVQANVELFYYKYHDQQIAHLDYSTNAANPLNPFLIFPTENVGASTYKGIEADLEARPARNTLLSLNVQYEDGVYDHFVYHTPNQNGGTGNGTGCPNGAAPGTVYTIDCSGFQPPMTPRWTATVGLRQTLPLSSGAAITGDARVHFQSSTYTGRYFLPTELQGGYALTDFDITYSSASERFFVGAYVHNAFDKIANNFSFPIPLSAMETGLLLPPRTFGGRFGIKF